ncbi:hypothetical protein ASG40_13515 [Methylobacterium sp. Leaf399]|uniref:AbrB/MazE/SpoVT family DNA-binding domain-containing protein n=1 Tax=unclassified Methylobacterium TaxID=2615210 RepID=UPI0006F1D893|nr:MULTISPECIES: AbrB/MazE/SpoVT family DNA-binding domain-containing protein [unclassified Methylobacterium]KQP50928.1 hypothetical protein ASF39_11890 [Methylobacterium sp. Leaf108]KQT07911.1 hypothetical protein ASG40_13515 [Methylobacterium sp. Leaf399]KQT89024.1 hypothetical protein ASG59_14280 [Methylobacterium sp. Leaf466]
MGRFEAKVTSKGQITVPARLRTAMHLKPGDTLVFVEDAGGYRLEAQVATFADLRGIVRGGSGAVTTDQITRWIEESRAARWGGGDSSGEDESAKDR